MPAIKTKAARLETARVLFLDVEMFPNLAYVWGKYEQDALGFLRERSLSCFGWNWLGEDAIHVRSLRHFKTYKRDKFDNRELTKVLHAQVSKADIIIGHNIKRFDDQEANTAFILNGLKPPPPHKLIDTLETLRLKFRFNSNRLGDACQLLGLPAKKDTGGFKLWLGCMAGDPAAWDKMEDYNRGDIVSLKALYFKERPWMTNHPDMNAKSGGRNCPKCQGKRLQQRGMRMTAHGRAPRFQCQECGGWCTGVLIRDVLYFR